MKLVKKIAIIMAVIFLALIIFGVINKVSDDNAIQDLQSAPVSTLTPTGELAEIFAFGTDYTDIQRENKLKEIKGNVVAWQLPVFEVKRDGQNYRVQTQNPKTFGKDETVVPTIITLMPQSDGDKTHIESLKTGDIISIKGIIYGVKMRHLLINPAYLYTQASESAVSTESNTPKQKEASLPFIGLRSFNFMGGAATEMSIEIKGDGTTIIKSFNFEGEQMVEYDGQYQNPIKLSNGKELLIENNKVISQTNNKTDYGCKGEEEKPCEADLYAEETSADLKPSFDCVKAGTSVEKMICSDGLLGKLDGALARNYKVMIAADIGDGAIAELKSTQQQWLTNRNNCADNQCLVNAYKARVDEVCEYPVISGVHPECLMSDDVQ